MEELLRPTYRADYSSTSGRLQHSSQSLIVRADCLKISWIEPGRGRDKIRNRMKALFLLGVLALFAAHVKAFRPTLSGRLNKVSMSLLMEKKDDAESRDDRRSFLGRSFAITAGLTLIQPTKVGAKVSHGG